MVSALLEWLERRISLPWRIRLTMLLGISVVNLVGVAILVALALWVIPLRQVANPHRVMEENGALAFAAFLIGTPITALFNRGVVRRVSRFVVEDRVAQQTERRAVLRAPAAFFLAHLSLWMAGAALAWIYNTRFADELGLQLALMVGLSGLTTAAVTYLVSERIFRPLARRALSSGVPDRFAVPTVAVRTMLAWLLGSGLAALGMMLVGIFSVVEPASVSKRQLSLTILVLGGITFLSGGLLTWLAAKASHDPLRTLRVAVGQVAAGNLGAEVQIYDGTELGVLQAGFNDMLHGLRERETIRDLFGRHVGTDVAQAALASGVQLGGEVRRVSVLFVDIIGSTSLATNRPPEDVVGLLNRFVDVVIDVVHEHGGWINKFEGDAALAIWGAPENRPDQAARVLAAARTLGAQLALRVPELQAGIGVSAGHVVAGNVGAAERYEYTVIGDPVNEAARLTGVAKSVPKLVVANAMLLVEAPEETAFWRELEPIVVRGRAESTRIVTPL